MQKNRNRPFLFYLAGQGISNLGEAFRFVAVTILIYRLTGSGMEAAVGLALSALPCILTSPFAGVLGDRFNERRVLALVDFARFTAAPIFIFIDNVVQVYLLLILLSFFDIFYNPSRRKFIFGMTGREGALKANSNLTGISGAAYLAGPLAAGFLTDAYGPAPAILIASFCCLCSFAFTVIASISYKITVTGKQKYLGSRVIPSRGCGGGSVRGSVRGSGRNSGNGSGGSSGRNSSRNSGGSITECVIANELKKGFRYSITTPDIKALLIIGMVTGFSAISVNLSFYPFAFDMLKVTAKGWSLMITIYYGTNLLAMLLLKCLGERAVILDGRLFYGGLCIVSIIWVLYTLSSNLASVLLLQFVEGTVIAVCSILLGARFQVITDKKFMARVASINDIFSNTGKLAGMGCTILIAGSFSFRAVFVMNGALLFMFAVQGLLCSRWVRNYCS